MLDLILVRCGIIQGYGLRSARMANHRPQLAGVEDWVDPPGWR
jgi:hypothetical protein